VIFSKIRAYLMCMQEPRKQQEANRWVSTYLDDLAKENVCESAASDNYTSKMESFIMTKNSPIGVSCGQRDTRKRLRNDGQAQGNVKRAKVLARCELKALPPGVPFSRLKVRLGRGVLFYKTRLPHRDVRSIIAYVNVSYNLFSLSYVSGLFLFFGIPGSADYSNHSGSLKIRKSNTPLVFYSTLEAEILAIWRGIVCLWWLLQYRGEIGFPQTEPGIILTNSLSAIEFIANARATSTSSLGYMAGRVQDHIIKNNLVLKYTTQSMDCAGASTKPLGQALHLYHRNGRQGYG
jgi:hypothetical protein